MKDLIKANIRTLFLPFGHMLICRSHSLFYVKNDYGIMIYNKDEMFEVYGIEITEDLINDLSLK